MNSFIYVLIYLVFINLVAIFLTVSDKNAAVNNKWRVKEKTLILIAILGGSISEYITMKIIRHKTKHKKFMIGIPFIIIIQIAIIVLILLKYNNVI